MTFRVTPGRAPALDGLRAIAAGLVLAFHLLAVPAGFIGVDIFFVLSGFLITALLMREWEKSRGIDLRAFWLRRSRRLLPAVTVTTLVAAAVAGLSGGEARVDLGRQVFGSVTGTYNWVEIARGSSYFDAANPRLLTMMWSLAVEQQFYLLWPLALLVLLRLRASARIGLVLAAAAASAAWHHHLLPDPTRAYMGTDSHLWGLMFGAALAFALPGALGGRKPASAPRSWAWGMAGWCGLLGICAMGLMGNGAWLHPWAMLAASACAVAVIRAVLPDLTVGPARSLAALLAVRPLVWLGTRSYGIYLWHWPLATLLYYAAPNLAPGITAPLVTASSIALAHLSYTRIEQPVVRLGWRGAARAWKVRIAHSAAPGAIGRILSPLAVASLAAWAIIVAPTMTTAERLIIEAQADSPRPGAPGAPTSPHAPESPHASGGVDSPDRAGEAAHRGAPGEPAGSVDSHSDAEPAAPRESGDPEDPAPPRHTAAAVRGDDVTIIGDSVTLAARPALEEALPGVAVDAEVSRSVRVAPKILADLKSRGELRTYVVIALATNGTIRPSDAAEILQAIGPDRTLVLVTGFGTSRTTWIGPANEEIHRFAHDNPHRVRIADWAHAIAGHTDLLAGDSIHPGPAASRIYATTIITALNQPVNHG
ncbi:MAG: acyltransferase family protein [Flaviflexus sp.]|nr:acyltransferase family protein [Flaviflexus sp.]